MDEGAGLSSAQGPEYGELVSCPSTGLPCTPPLEDRQGSRNDPGLTGDNMGYERDPAQGTKSTHP